MQGIKYSMANNLRFVVQNIWNWSKMNTIVIVLQIPLTIFLPYISTYNMKKVINFVELQERCIDLIIPFLLMCIVAAISKYCEKYIEWSLRGYRYTYINSINKKRMSTSYENTISSKGQELLGRAKNLVSHDEATAQAIVITILGVCSSFVGVIVYGVIVCRLKVLVFGVIVLSSIVNFLFVKKIREYEYSVRQYTWPLDRKIAYITAKSSDLNNAKDIRLFSFSKCFKTLFDLFSYERMEWHSKVLKKEYIGVVIGALLVLVRDSVGYAYLVHQFYLEELELGNFTYYVGIIAGLSIWITNLLYNYGDLLQMSYDISDLRTYLDMPDENVFSSQELNLQTINEIELRNVSYCFNDSENCVIRDVSMKVKKGEKIAIVGLNGAGKTTLVSLICGLLKPTEGEILYNGIPSQYYDKEEIFKNFSAVFQDIGLIPMSIKENITFSTNDRCNDIRANKIIKLSGVDEFTRNYPNGINNLLVKEVNEDAVQLSGGEMQKLALARAMYKESSVMVLDEPTAALDAISEAEIYGKYEQLFANKISFYISHRLASTQFCDRILFLEKGCIVEEGTHEKLLKLEGNYSKLFSTQSKYYES